MKLKSLGIEFLIIALISLIVIFVIRVGISILFGNYAIDINMHDTYFVVSWRGLIIPVIVLIITIIYLIKEAFYSYKRRFQNMILLFCVFLINVMLLFWVSVIYKIASQVVVNNRGWTIYPPLSALPKAVPNTSLNTSPYFENILHILSFVQILFLVLMVIIAVLTGKNWNIYQREN